MIDYSGGTVEAIEDGRIVRVTEDYARREGLLILRKQAHVSDAPLSVKEKKDEGIRKNKGFVGMDDLRKPLKSQKTEVMNELLDNFHWILLEKRKSRGLTRKKAAEALGESEMNIKMIENGVLPMNNFVLVNKLESYYGVSLRRNKVATSGGAQLRQIIDFAKKEAPKEENKALKGENKGSPNGDEEVLDLTADGDIDVSKF
jgi:ribosome-binding protein aMBF1 (putative translation factor)